MVTHLKSLLLTISTGLLMMSCSTNENDTITTQGFIDCYAIVTDLQSGVQTVSQPVTFKLDLNWTTNEAAATMSGLNIGGTSYPVITMPDMKWAMNNTWCYITNTPTAKLATGQTVAMSDFKFNWNDRMDMPDLEAFDYDPAFIYSFKLEDKYMVAGSRVPFNLYGTTTASAEGVEPYTSDVNLIVASPDFKNNTITVLINGAKFAAQMPGLNIQLDNIPMILSADGTINFQIDNLIPTIAGTPYPNYPISDVNGSIDPMEGMTLSFNCNVMGRMMYLVTTSPTLFGYR